MRKRSRLLLACLLAVWGSSVQAEERIDEFPAAPEAPAATKAPTAAVQSFAAGSLELIERTVSGQRCWKTTFEGAANGAAVDVTLGPMTLTNMAGLIDSDAAGGSGNFANEPSPDTIVYQSGSTAPSVTFSQGMNSVSFWLASPYPVTVTYQVGTDTVSTVIDGAPNGTVGGDPSGSFDLFRLVRYESPSIPISAMRIAGHGGSMGFDDLEVCAQSLLPLTSPGFEAPMDRDWTVKSKPARVVPLKLELFDAEGVEITAADVAPPVLQILYSSTASGDPVFQDVSSLALPVGAASEGNQFVYTDDGKWQYNLKTSNLSATGLYVLRAVSGDPDIYTITPNCETRMSLTR